jgi:hypothetical protein
MPHVERLARLLHNRIVRRVRHSHPSAETMLLVADLVDGHIHLQPVSVWDESGAVIAGTDARHPAVAGSAETTAPEIEAGPDAGTGAGTEAGTEGGTEAERAAWELLVGDLRPEFALLARVAPVALFAPYLLDLRQIDLRSPTGDTI